MNKFIFTMIIDLHTTIIIVYFRGMLYYYIICTYAMINNKKKPHIIWKITTFEYCSDFY